MRGRWFAALVAATALHAHAGAVHEGMVVRVADGDTLTVLTRGDHRKLKVRLGGIDAPELDQPDGRSSRASLVALVVGRPVRLDCPKTDRYRREVCRVHVGTLDVNREQLRRGMAWHFTRHANEQPPEEREADVAVSLAARAARRGLFARSDAVAPWEWRRR